MSDIVPSVSTPLVFTFPETAQHVRSVMIDGEPWWFTRDVAEVLEIGNIHSSIALLDEDEKGLHAVETLGGPQKFSVINEPGLYSLILRSRKPQAKAFKRWLTHEVIPALRTTGSYRIAPAAPALPQDYEEALVALIGQVRESKALSARVAELEPAAQSWNTLAEAVGDYAVADAAKILSRDPSVKLGRNRLFTLLDDMRWTYRQQADDRPRVMQTAIQRGWLSELPMSHYHPRTGELVLDPPQVRVTVKGLHELHKRLGGTAASLLPSVPQQRGGTR